MEFARAISGYADATPPQLRRLPTAVIPAVTTMLLQAEPEPAAVATEPGRPRGRRDGCLALASAAPSPWRRWSPSSTAGRKRRRAARSPARHTRVRRSSRRRSR